LANFFPQEDGEAAPASNRVDAKGSPVEDAEDGKADAGKIRAGKRTSSSGAKAEGHPPKRPKSDAEPPLAAEEGDWQTFVAKAVELTRLE
jgi:hypothetical protein